MSSTPLDSFVLWTRQRAEALSKAMSSIMHVGLIRTLTALKKPTAIWVTKISSIFQFWLSLYEGRSYVPQCACTHRCPQLCTSVRACVCTGAIRNMLLDNSLGFTHKLSQLCASWSASVWVTVLMSSFHAVLCSLVCWSCRFAIFLLQICVFQCTSRIMPAVVGRWGIHTKKGSTPLRRGKRTISCQ